MKKRNNQIFTMYLSSTLLILLMSIIIVVFSNQLNKNYTFKIGDIFAVIEVKALKNQYVSEMYDIIKIFILPLNKLERIYIGKKIFYSHNNIKLNDKFKTIMKDLKFEKSEISIESIVKNFGIIQKYNSNIDMYYPSNSQYSVTLKFTDLITREDTFYDFTFDMNSDMKILSFDYHINLEKKDFQKAKNFFEDFDFNKMKNALHPKLLDFIVIRTILIEHESNFKNEDKIEVIDLELINSQIRVKIIIKNKKYNLIYNKGVITNFYKENKGFS
jgi:hypothetical protein